MANKVYKIWDKKHQKYQCGYTPKSSGADWYNDKHTATLYILIMCSCWDLPLDNFEFHCYDIELTRLPDEVINV